MPIFSNIRRVGTRPRLRCRTVPQEVKEERHARLLGLVNEIGGRKYESCVGRQVQILVEGPSKTNHARMMGRSRQAIKS